MTDTTPSAADETQADVQEITTDDVDELKNVAGEADTNANELEPDVEAIETPSQESQEAEAEAISEANRAADPGAGPQPSTPDVLLPQDGAHDATEAAALAQADADGEAVAVPPTEESAADSSDTPDSPASESTESSESPEPGPGEPTEG